LASPKCISLIQISEEVKRGFANVGESSKGIQISEDLKTTSDGAEICTILKPLFRNLKSRIRLNPFA
jgi:hypothetical protein